MPKKPLITAEDHPLFWDHIPPEGLNHEILQGIETIKAESTPEARFENYRKQGNEFFSVGKERYSDALHYYKLGVLEPIADVSKRSIMWGNIAAINLNLGNYGKCIADCTEAIKYDKTYLKAYFRGAQACNHLEKYEQAIKFCEEGLKEIPDNKQLKSLLESTTKKWITQKEVKQRKDEEKRKIKEEKDKLEHALLVRGVLMGEKTHNTSAQFRGNVHWDPEDDETLRWPVVFAYPEHAQCDFIESFGEHDRFIDHLELMFPGEPAFWDEEKKYVFDELVVYYQTNVTDIVGKGKNYKPKRWREVNVNSSLLEVLQQEDHVIPTMPLFSIFVRRSPYLKEFMQREKDNQ